MLADEARAHVIGQSQERGSLLAVEVDPSDFLDRDRLESLDNLLGEESQKLRELAEYLMRGYVGPHAKTIELILRKVPR